MSGSVLAIIGDMHIGSTVGLATPEYQVHTRYDLEAQTVRANKVQAWLWECWRDYWNYVYSLCKNRRLIVVHLGDLIDGVHHQSTQVMPEIADQSAMALNIMTPIVAKASAFFGIFGTGIHAGIDNTDEARLYQEIGAQDYGHQLTLDIDGYIHAFQHHGRAGARPWTSSAAGVAAEVMIDYATRGQKPPNFVWTAHNHRIDDSGAKFPETRAISIPSWQLKNSFGWRVAGNTIRSDIGAFIVLDGHIIDGSKARYLGQPDERKVIVV